MSKPVQAVTKKVAKKTEVEVVAAPVAVAAPAKKAAAKPAVAVAAPVAVAPVASVVAAVAVEDTKSVDQEIGTLITVFQAQRDAAVSAIKSLQKLQKRVAKEVKEAGRRRRRAKKEDENGVPKEKRPTIFTTPVTLKDELCVFLGKAKGSFIAPAMDQSNGMQVFAIREARDHPWVLSTTRHISQGGVCLLDEKWDKAANILSGKSAVIGGDPYVLSVHLPAGFKLKAAEISGEKVESTSQGEIVSVRTVPSATKTVEWKRLFSK